MRCLTGEPSPAAEFNRPFSPRSAPGRVGSPDVPDAIPSPPEPWQDLSTLDPSPTTTPMDEDLAGWYADVRETLTGKPPRDVARELPGLVDHLADADDRVDHYVVAVSFTRNHTCLDYAVDRVTVDGDGEPVTETVKAPASGSHRYVHFAHPPDPQFDAAALRARLLAAVDDERRALAEVEEAPSGFAGLWEKL